MANILKYDVLYETLRGRMLSGYYPGGEALPREVDLAREFKVARNTLRCAMGMLEKDGLIRRIKSKGTFVCGKKHTKIKYLLILNENYGLEAPCQYIVPHLQAAAELSGIELELTCRRFLSSLTVEQGAKSIRDAGVSGVIALTNNMCREDHLYLLLKAAGIPVLLPHGAKNDREITGFAVLRIDFAKSLKDAFAWLAGLGHRRIALLSKTPGEYSVLWNNALLEAGILKTKEDFRVVRELSLNEYFSLLRELNLSDDPALLQFSTGAPLEIRENINALMSRPEPPTALIGFSDFYAMYAMQELKLRGIGIPDRMSVLGLCGYPGGAYLSPDLTTVSYDYERIGWKCLELMPEVIRIAREGGVMPDVVMEHRLIERKSTAVLTKMHG